RALPRGALEHPQLVKDDAPRQHRKQREAEDDDLRDDRAREQTENESARRFGRTSTLRLLQQQREREATKRVQHDPPRVGVRRWDGHSSIRASLPGGLRGWGCPQTGRIAELY